MAQRLRRPPTEREIPVICFCYGPETSKPIFGVSSEGIDLLDRLLSFDPRQRSTAEEALTHPFLDHYHSPEEPIAERINNMYLDIECGVQQWKRKLFEKKTFFYSSFSLVG
ncbi:unnamed protein product [Rotaria sp. Silwood2]|nr:unnamed protein product [Rotaria sp. Silwood2]CAF3056178.1 unnamed protein product [Rotaria sp. Silwood2]CAF4255352.1 unnamed protein product [Rotaria sp. Silwood2]CAF4289070.1 unnamed protein product [Rotaria sp. Silwood2]